MGHHEKQKGFTIVELLIVIVVIAILAAVTIVAYNGIKSRAVKSSMQADLRNVQAMIEIEKVHEGAYPASLDSINEGRGFVPSGDNQLIYGIESYGFCVHVVNQNSDEVFRLKSSDGTIDATGGCKALEAVSVAGGYFNRSSLTSHSRTFTMPDAYTPERWLVGVIMRRNQSTEPTVTVDSNPVTPSLHEVVGGFGHTWYVAQPTGSTTTVEYAGLSTSAEYAFVTWQVFSNTQPVIQDSISVAAGSPESMDGYPGGAILASAIYASSTLPGGSIPMSYHGGAAGWSFYYGEVYPTSAASYVLSVPSGGATAVNVIGS